MAELTGLQKRVITVLGRIIEQVKADKGDAKVWAEILDETLDVLQQDDFFGTESQNDPRGDFRVHRSNWTCLENVEGVE